MFEVISKITDYKSHIKDYRWSLTLFQVKQLLKPTSGTGIVTVVYK